MKEIIYPILVWLICMTTTVVVASAIGQSFAPDSGMVFLSSLAIGMVGGFLSTIYAVAVSDRMRWEKRW